MAEKRQTVWDPLRKKDVALTPEERVRQWFIGELHDLFSVPMHMMMSEVAIKLGKKDFRTDIMVYGRDARPLMAVECKREDVTLDRSVLEQVLKYNLALEVKYLAITNGTHTFLFERQGDAFGVVRTVPDWEGMQAPNNKTGI